MWSNFANTQNLTGINGGMFTVIETDGNGCMHWDTITIAEPMPLMSTLTTTNVNCYGAGTGSILASVTGGTMPYSYTWSGTTGIDSIATNLTMGSYSLLVTDMNGCTVTSSANITQPLTALNATATLHDMSCNNANDGSITVNATGGTGGYTYMWNTGQTTAGISNLSMGADTVTVTDGNGCMVVLGDSIHNPSAITSTIAGTNVTCANAHNGSVTLTVSGGTGTYTYMWSNFANTQNLTGINGGMFTVIETDGSGCMHWDTITITEPMPLMSALTTTNVNCYGGGTGSILATVTGGTQPYSYTWTGTAGNDSIATNLTMGSYSLLVTDANGCTVNGSANITQPLTGISISATVHDMTCNNANNGSITVNATGGTGGYSYMWNGGQTTATISNLRAGADTVTVTDANGCKAMIGDSIHNPSAITSAISGTNVTCASAHNGALTLTVRGGTGSYTYLWSNFANTQNLSGINGGLYSVVITDASGCMHRDSILIAEPAPMILSSATTVPSCSYSSNGAINLTAQGGVRPYTYSWNNGQATANISNLSGGTYHVIVMDSNHCQMSDSVTLVAPAALSVNNGITQPSCAGSTNGSIALSVSGGTIPYSYRWNTNDSTHILSGRGAGTYTVIITDSKGCIMMDTAKITQPAPISATMSVVNPTCFDRSTGSAVVIATGGVAPYTYELGTLVQSTDSFSNLPAGVYTAEVTDVNGCRADATFTVASPGYLKVHASVTPNIILAGETIQLWATDSSDVSITSIVWTPSDSLSCSTCDSTTARPTHTTDYIVTVMNARGCMAADTVRVTVSNQPSVFIPGGFTPNGDYMNDRFQFDILGATTVDVKIWNRWGNLVYSNPAQHNGIDQTGTEGWDGKYNGDEVQFDTYTYQFDVTYFDGHHETKTGTVIVMR
jgi:gliding motility-associated-like protein